MIFFFFFFFFFSLNGKEFNIFPINVIINKIRDINVDGDGRQRGTKTYTPMYLLMLTGLQKTALQWSCCCLIRCCKRLAKLIGLTWFYWTCWLSLLILWLHYLKSHWLFQQQPTVSPSYHFMLVSWVPFPAKHAQKTTPLCSTNHIVKIWSWVLCERNVKPQVGSFWCAKCETKTNLSIPRLETLTLITYSPNIYNIFISL